MDLKCFRLPVAFKAHVDETRLLIAFERQQHGKIKVLRNNDHIVLPGILQQVKVLCRSVHDIGSADNVPGTRPQLDYCEG
jgi:hypothetical protein